MHPFLAKVTTEELLDELDRARGLRPRRRAVGGRQRDRVPRERLRLVHDRRSRLRQQPAPLSGRRSPWPPSSRLPPSSRAPSASTSARATGSTITQERIDRFADATGDHQWIHVDPGARRAGTLRRRPIAHGYLTLSLVNHFLPADRRGARHLDGRQLRRRPPALSRAGAGRLAHARRRRADRGREHRRTAACRRRSASRSRSRAASGPACVVDTISRYYPA